MMTWNPDPVFFSIGPIAVRYYGLMFVIGFISMGHYVKKVFKEHDLEPGLVDNLINYLIVGMLVGSRLAHCLFYEPSYYLSRPLEILMIWKGGLASHGGYAGVILAIYLFMKRNPGLSFNWLLDKLIGPCVFVGGLIRIGNFFNSEIIGKTTDMPWGIIFERVDTVARHPSQLYEAIGYLSFGIAYMLIARSKKLSWHNGALCGLGISACFVFRFLIEFTKKNQSTMTESLPINMGQFLSIGFVLLGLGIYQITKKTSAISNT
jgi:prolipoprotein diacylglyceryl transferase